MELWMPTEESMKEIWDISPSMESFGRFTHSCHSFLGLLEMLTRSCRGSLSIQWTGVCLVTFKVSVTLLVLIDASDLGSHLNLEMWAATEKAEKRLLLKSHRHTCTPLCADTEKG